MKKKNLNNYLLRNLTFSDTFEDQHSYPLISAADILSHSKFDRSKKTVLYIYGFTHKMDYKSIKMLFYAYKSRNDHNLVILDWEKIASGNYFLDGLPNTVRYSKILADSFLDLMAHGFNLSSLHIVGHSIGSHLAGFAGKHIQRKTNGRVKLKRITGDLSIMNF